MEIINRTIIKRQECFVTSESTKGAYYLVSREKNEWQCSCPSNNLADRTCKHIEFVQLDPVMGGEE